MPIVYCASWSLKKKAQRDFDELARRVDAKGTAAVGAIFLLSCLFLLFSH